MKIGISGAGIAGPTLAYWLMRAGFQPTLIETAPHLRTGGYIVDFWGLGYEIAERMGILAKVRQAGYAVEEVRFVDGRGRRAGGFGVDVFRQATGDRFTSLPRGDLAAEIYGSIGNQVETLFDTSITAIEEHSAGVRVGLSNGEDRDFDLLIGADGLHSKVRALAFGPEGSFERSLGYYVAAFEANGYRPRDDLVFLTHGAAGRQISRFTERGDRTMFLLILAEDLLKGEPPHTLDERKAALARAFAGSEWEWPAIRAAMERADEIYFDRVSQIVIDRWSKGRVALIGDAAACVSLLAGEGSGLAMVEAYVLAGEIASSPADHGHAFAQYEKRLRSFIAGKQKSAYKFAGFFAPKTALGVWVRNQFTRLLRVRRIAERFVAGDLRDDFVLPDYRPLG